MKEIFRDQHELKIIRSYLKNENYEYIYRHEIYLTDVAGTKRYLVFVYIE